MSCVTMTPRFSSGAMLWRALSKEIPNRSTKCWRFLYFDNGLDFSHVILVPWSVKPSCWSVGIFYHWNWWGMIDWMDHIGPMDHLNQHKQGWPSVWSVFNGKRYQRTIVWSGGPRNKYDPEFAEPPLTLSYWKSSVDRGRVRHYNYAYTIIKITTSK